MITDAITQTPLTTPEADGFFGDAVTCDDLFHVNEKVKGWQEDESTLAVLRALLPGRMDTYESCHLHFNRVPTHTCIPKYLRINTIYDQECDSLTIVNIVCDDTTIPFLQAVQNILTANPRLREAEKVAQVCKVISIAHDPGRRCGVIFCKDMDFESLHVAAALIPAAVPWFFTACPLEESEKDLLKSMFDNTCDRFIGLLAKLSDELGIPAPDPGNMTEKKEPEPEIEILRRELEKYRAKYGPLEEEAI